MLSNTSQSSPFSVLIVDKSGANPALLRNYCPYVIWAKNQKDLLSLIQTITFKLILLDLNGNGLALIKFIKDAACINKQTPVIGLMDATLQAAKKDIIDAGFDDCLTTPLTTERIFELFDLWQIDAYNTEASGYISVILEKTLNNRSLTLTILNKLFEELPHQVAAIEKALIQNEYTVAVETTHKLHGSVCMCGFTDMEKPANALESCLINKNYQALWPHFQLLQQSILNFTEKQSAILSHLEKSGCP